MGFSFQKNLTKFLYEVILQKNNVKYKNPLFWRIYFKINIIFAQRKPKVMIVIFDKDYLEELYSKGKTNDKKHRFQPNIVKRYIKRIDTLKHALNIGDIYKFPV